jgi:hypothetical protein
VQLCGRDSPDLGVVTWCERADILHWHAGEQLVHDERGEAFSCEAEAHEHAGGGISNEGGLLRTYAAQEGDGMAVVFKANQLLEVREHADVRVSPPHPADFPLRAVSLCQLSRVYYCAIGRVGVVFAWQLLRVDNHVAGRYHGTGKNFRIAEQNRQPFDGGYFFQEGHGLIPKPAQFFPPRSFRCVVRVIF